MVLHITLSKETCVNDKSPVMFVLATVYRPPGHHTDFIKQFADFLSELVLAADKVLIVGDFNIHADNEKDLLGSAFIDILNSIGVKQRVRTYSLSKSYSRFKKGKGKGKWCVAKYGDPYSEFVLCI